jgi:hypothetical protein
VILTELRYDAAEDALIVKREQDVQPILDANRRAFNDSPEHGRYIKGDMHRVASIPNVVVEQWLQEGINIFDRADWPKVRQKLNSPEYAYLRTKPGRV